MARAGRACYDAAVPITSAADLFVPHSFGAGVARAEGP